MLTIEQDGDEEIRREEPVAVSPVNATGEEIRQGGPHGLKNAPPGDLLALPLRVPLPAPSVKSVWAALEGRRSEPPTEYHECADEVASQIGLAAPRPHGCRGRQWFAEAPPLRENVSVSLRSKFQAPRQPESAKVFCI